MISKSFSLVIDKILRYNENTFNKAHWKYWLPFIAVLVSLFFAFPSYDLAHSDLMKDNWNAIIGQTMHPFSPHAFNPASHLANIAFRLTPILIAKILMINTINGFLFLQLIAFILLFIFLSRLFEKITKDIIATTYSTLSISFIFIGNVLCSDYRGFFDVFSYLFLTLALYTNYSILVLLFSLLAYFSDERSLIASGIIFLFFAYEKYDDLKVNSWVTFLIRNKKIATILISWCIYFITRYVLATTFKFETNTYGILNYLLTESIHHINILPFGLWTGLEGYWFLIILSIISLFYKKYWTFLSLFILTMFAVMFLALWVFDITRSMAYLLPSIFLSIYIIKNDYTIEQLRTISLLVFIICLFPTYYAGGPYEIHWLLPLPIQLIRMLL